MKTTQHDSSWFQFTRFGVFNCHLVREADGFTLVDTGLQGSAGQLLAAAGRLGAEIRRIVLTHAHVDHVGSLDELVRKRPGIEVVISARDSRLLAGDFSLDPSEPQQKIRGGFIKRETKPTRLVRDGDRIGSLRVVASPGHTPGHVSYFDERTGSLHAGDALQAVWRLIVAGDRNPFFPFSAMATWDRPLALSSARRLRELAPSAVGFGHGSILANPRPFLNKAIAHAEKHFQS